MEVIEVDDDVQVDELGNKLDSKNSLIKVIEIDDDIQVSLDLIQEGRAQIQIALGLQN